MRRRILKSTLIGILLTLLVVSLGYAAPPPPASLIEISATANEEMLPAVAYSTTLVTPISLPMRMTIMSWCASTIRRGKHSSHPPMT